MELFHVVCSSLDKSIADRLTEAKTDHGLVACEVRFDGVRIPHHVELIKGLTPRQRARPGSEIADSIGIFKPTFNDHVRAALCKLCRTIFKGNTSAA